jgi:hypothetical protein
MRRSSRSPGIPRLVTESTLRNVRQVLQSYAGAGLFTAFSVTSCTSKVGNWAIAWRYLPCATLTVDAAAHELTLSHILPQVSSRSSMGKSYRLFLKGLSAPSRPRHRRVDPGKVRFVCRSTSGGLALRCRMMDGDFEYATRAFIKVLQESIYEFLLDGPYCEYRVTILGFDPDRATA